MAFHSLNTEEVKLIQDYRRMTTGQQQVIMLTVQQLAADSQESTNDLPENVFALIKRA